MRLPNGSARRWRRSSRRSTAFLADRDKDMGEREYHVLIEKDDVRGLIGTVPQLRDCTAYGRDLDELMVNIKKAIRLARIDDDLDMDSGFVGVYKLEVEVEER